MSVVFIKDHLRAAVEGATGGKMTVLYDDKGHPNYMVVIPKFNCEDVDPTAGGDARLGTGTHPAFVVNGDEKSEIYIGAYPAKVLDGRGVVLPGVDPSTNLEYDDAVTYCANKGAGWHLMTAWEWSAVALWCLQNGYQCRGNTDYGRSHEANHETATRTDGGDPGSTSGTPRTLTGCGPASWRHDNTYQGIADLVGNVWEWNHLLKINDGRLYVPDDNDYSLAEGSWPAQGVYFDGTAGGSSGDVGDPVLSNATPNNSTSSDGYLFLAPWRSITKNAGYNGLGVSVREKMCRLCIDPTFNTDNPKGSVWARNHGERLPLRGGCWNNGSDSGLFALYLSNVRSISNSNIGFRPAFIC